MRVRGEPVRPQNDPIFSEPHSKNIALSDVMMVFPNGCPVGKTRFSHVVEESRFFSNTHSVALCFSVIHKGAGCREPSCHSLKMALTASALSALLA